MGGRDSFLKNENVDIRTLPWLALILISATASLAAEPRWADAAVLASLSPIRELEHYPPGFYDGDPLPPRTAYLSFDDGPTEFTEEILDICAQESVKASFFLCARWAKETWLPQPSAYDLYPHTLRRMYAQGHAIGNHTANHQSFTDLGPQGIARELKTNAMLLEWAIGPGYPAMTLVRPPFGAPWWKNGQAWAMRSAGEALRNTGVVCMWNDFADSYDSHDYPRGEWYTKAGTDRSTPEFMRKADKIAQRILAAADGRGMVILMHDSHPSSVAALPRIISGLKARGYNFSTMEDWVRWRYGISSAELLKKKPAPRLSIR